MAMFECGFERVLETIVQRTNRKNVIIYDIKPMKKIMLVFGTPMDLVHEDPNLHLTA